MSTKNNRASLNNFFNKSKGGSGSNKYKSKNGYNPSRKGNFGTPEKLNLKVVESIQDKKVLVQEDTDFKTTELRSRDKASKYKGKKQFDKSEPRSKSYKGRTPYQKNIKKRSAKREEKENESDSEHTALWEKANASGRKNSTVTFKNLNSEESLVSRKRVRVSREDSSEGHFTRTRGSAHVPPKSEAQKELNRQWAQDLPEEVSEKTKQYLLSINDQAERNRELSSMIETGEISTSGRQLSLAVLPCRKSHIKNKPRQSKTSRGQINEKRMDEAHYQVFNESRKFVPIETNDQDTEKDRQVKPEDPANRLKSTIEYVSIIRARGERAKQRAANQTSKNTPNVKLCKTPQSKGKFTPIPFPDLNSDEKDDAEMEEPVKEIEESSINEEREAPKETEVEPSTNGLKKMEVEDKVIAVVEKVQIPHKDISVPLITEIQPKVLRDSSYEVAAQLAPKLVARLTPTPVGQSKQVVETIREQFGNIRSPAKINNRIIVQAEEPSLQPLTENDSEFKTPLPKKPRSTSVQEPKEKASEVMATFPMRINYKERPKEYDDIILPNRLQLTFDFFTELDNAINNCKRRGKIPVFSNLKPYVEQATNRTFDIDSFKRVFYVAPELYYYKWQTSQGAGSEELRIEVPDNIEEILSKIHSKSTTVRVNYSPLTEAMTNFLTNKRKIIVRTRLILYMEKLHENFLNSTNASKTEFNAIKGWHPNFDIQSIMDLPNRSIALMSKSKKSETITEFLKNKNIKNALLRRAAESMSKDGAIKSDVLPSTQSTLPSSTMFNSIEKRSPAKITNATISPTFYKRIETKEKMYREEKQLLEEENRLGENKRKQELMLKIALAVKSVFGVQNKVNTLFLNHVLKYLNDSQRGNFYTKKELIHTLKEISDIVPEWLTLKQHERGFLVKL
jgi:hypothetical protein